jgi:hypothetical protein
MTRSTDRRRNRLALGSIFLAGCFASPNNKVDSAIQSSDGGGLTDGAGPILADGGTVTGLDGSIQLGLDATIGAVDGAGSGIEFAGAGGGAGAFYDSGATGGTGGPTPSVDAPGATGGAGIAIDAPAGTGGLPDAAMGTGGTAGGSGGAGSGGAGGASSHPDAAVTPDAAVDAPLLSNGVACTLEAQCSSNHCVDNVCCSGACDGQCESCSEAGSVGVCSVVSSGKPRGDRTACAGAGKCQAQCDGTNGKACAYPTATTACSPASCSGGTITSASVCNGAGACTATTTSQCSSNLCATDGTAKCSTSCTASSCPAGNYCDTTGVCIKKKEAGLTCTTAPECESGFCADGICCTSACAGQCMACSAAGTCIRITGMPRNGRTTCTATDANCGGTCDGTSDTCVYPGSSKSCSAAACTSDLAYKPASVCNGAGTCTSPSPVTCDLASYCSNASCISRVVSSVAITTTGPFSIAMKDKYVYVGEWQGSTYGGNLSVVDVNNVAQPSIVGKYTNATAEIHAVAIRDTRVYLANDTDGLAVVDVSNPTLPTRLFSHSADCTYAHAVTTGNFGSGSSPYALVGGLRGISLDAFDLSDPTKLGTPIVYTTAISGALDIFDIVGTNSVGYLLITGGTLMALETVDLSQLPQAPTRLGGVSIPMSTYGGWGEMKLVGSTLYLAASNHSTHVGGLRTINVSNPSAPAIIGSLDVADLGSVPWEGVGLDVVGTRAYIVGKTALHVFDVSTPASPAEVALIPLPEAYVGDFGGNVVVSGDYAYGVVTTVEAAKGGFIVFRITGL